MANGRLQPARNKLSDIEPSLSKDELALIDFLDESLPDDWEIYARPYMNGDWPSVAILKPDVGVMIYDVLRWESGEFIKDPEEIEINSKRFIRADRLRPADIQADDIEYLRSNPRQDVQRYRDNLIGLYLPQVGEQVDDTPNIQRGIRIGLYCSNLETAEARNLLGGLENCSSVFGHDHLNPEALENLVAPVLKEQNWQDLSAWADQLRSILSPPFHTKEEGRPISLSPQQEKYATPTPGKHRRLKGAAGSGKTLVIAERAAKNAAKGDRVLVVYYNITLGHYITSYIEKAYESFDRRNIEVIHFHAFCSRYMKENGIPWPTDADGSNADDLLTKEVPRRVIEGMQRAKNNKNRQYDVILIDEGQDFEELWFEALNHFLTGSNEVLLVADERQNIYKRSHSFGGMRFSGPWGSLNASYRMPANLVREVNRFAASFVTDPDTAYATGMVSESPLQMDLGFDHPMLVWQNVDEFDRVVPRVIEAVDFLTTKGEAHPQDIVVLLPNHARGREMADAFADQGFAVNHVFGTNGSDAISRRHKKTFFMDAGRLKMSTIHSFKGWEMANVIIVTPESDGAIPPGSSLDLLLYTAITRAQNTLFVFNQHPHYQEFGNDWTSTWE